jgi:predicted GIY-YIG superfamily endonuclease
METFNTASFSGCYPHSDFWFVYILLCADGTLYTGCTSNIEERLHRHQLMQVDYTSKRLPVKLIYFSAFNDKYKAYQFEKYLKPGSGRAFAKKHLLPAQ